MTASKAIGNVTAPLFTLQGNNISIASTVDGPYATIALSANSQSVQPIGTASIGIGTIGNTGGTTGFITGTSPQLLFVAQGALSASQSINGNSGTISLSAPAQTVETNIGTMTIGSAAAGSSVTGTSPSLIFAQQGAIGLGFGTAAGGAITVSISAPTQTIQPIGTATIGSLVAGSSVTGTSPSLVFAQQGAIGLGFGTAVGGAITVSISAPTQTIQPIGTGSFGVGTGGNTAGTTGQITGTSPNVLFVGGNNITLSQSSAGSAATISIIGPSAAAAGTGSFGVGSGGNTAGSTGQVTGTSPNILFVALGGLTASQSSNGASATISLSSPRVGTMSFGVGGLGNTAGTTGQISNSSPNIQIVALGGITASQSIDNNSILVLSLSAPVQSEETNIGTGSIGVGTVGNTAGNTGQISNTSPTVLFVGLGAITASQATDTNRAVTISFSAPAQTVQPIGTISLGMSTSGNTAGTASLITGTSPNYVFAGLGAVTLSQATGANAGTLSISVPVQSVQPIGTVTLAAGTTTVSGTSPSLSIVANGNVTLAAATAAGGAQTISISALPEGTVTFGSAAAGSSITGTSPSILLVGQGNAQLAFGTAAQAITASISVPAASNTFGMSNLGLTSGTSGTISGSNNQLLFAGTNGLFMSQSINGASATISVQPRFMSASSIFLNAAGSPGASSASGTNWVYPFYLEQPMSFTGATLYDSISIKVGGTGSASFGYGFDLQIFSLTGSTLTQVAYQSGAGTSTSTAATTGANSTIALTGQTVVLPPGPYWMALHGWVGGSTTATSNATQTVAVQASAAFFYVVSTSNSALSVLKVMGLGSWSGTSNSNGSTASMLTSDIASNSTIASPMIVLGGA